MNICIVDGNRQYTELARALGFTIVEFDKAEIVLFTGGEDVSPYLYGDKAHAYTGNSKARDAYEAQLFSSCVDRGIPMVGICRGGQFLNVMSGGRMMQHCEGHTQAHEIEDLDTGESIYVSSTHHQIMLPGDKAEMVAVSVRSVGCEWYDGNIARRESVDNTAEVVFYPDTKSLCFQPHPEFGTFDDGYSQMVYYFERLLHKYLIPSKVKA
jgi:carbamoylphosphate synthase small subunit